MKVLKIGAVWCSGCLVMKPRWKEIESENPWLETQYFDYDENREKVAPLGIDKERLPVFIFLDKAGAELTRLTGEVTKEELLRTIGENKDR